MWFLWTLASGYLFLQQRKWYNPLSYPIYVFSWNHIIKCSHTVSHGLNNTLLYSLHGETISSRLLDLLSAKSKNISTPSIYVTKTCCYNFWWNVFLPYAILMHMYRQKEHQYMSYGRKISCQIIWPYFIDRHSSSDKLWEQNIDALTLARVSMESYRRYRLILDRWILFHRCNVVHRL